MDDGRVGGRVVSSWRERCVRSDQEGVGSVGICGSAWCESASDRIALSRLMG